MQLTITTDQDQIVTVDVRGHSRLLRSPRDSRSGSAYSASVRSASTMH